MRSILTALAAAALLLGSGQQPTFAPARPFGTLRQQAQLQQAWLKERLEVNLPAVMRAHGVDMWVVPMREYNEDPVFRALVSPTTFAARRRTIYVFFDRGAERGVERLALGGTSQGGRTRPTGRRCRRVVRACARSSGGRSSGACWRR